MLQGISTTTTTTTTAAITTTSTTAITTTTTTTTTATTINPTCQYLTKAVEEHTTAQVCTLSFP